MTIAFRFAVITQPISWDVTTYILITKQMIHGATYYVDVWDTKPIGLFFLLMPIVAVFKNPILAVNVFAILLISGTALLIYVITSSVTARQKAASLLGATIYVYLMASSRAFLSANAEVFFLPFVAASFCVWFRSKRSIGLFCSGLLMGVGFIIKYLVLFDFLALAVGVALLSLFQHPKERWAVRMKGLARNAVLLSAGFGIPFGLILVGYWIAGHFGEFWDASFTVSRNYGRAVRFEDAYEFIRDRIFSEWVARIGLGFTIAVLIWDWRRWRDRLNVYCVILWLCASIFAAIYPGRYFHHYAAQAFLPISVIVGIGLSSTVLPGRRTRIFAQVGACVWIIGISAPTIWKNYEKYSNRKNVIYDVADYLRGRVGASDCVYTSNGDHLLYLLLNTVPPTKYVHPSLAYGDEHGWVGVEPEAILDEVFARRPKYVLVTGGFEWDRGRGEAGREERYLRRLKSIVDGGYHLEKTFSGKREIEVFRRNE